MIATINLATGGIAMGLCKEIVVMGPMDGETVRYLVVTPNFVEATDLEEALHDNASCEVVVARSLDEVPRDMAIRAAFVAAKHDEIAGNGAMAALQGAGMSIVVLDGDEDRARRAGWRVLERPFTNETLMRVIGAVQRRSPEPLA